MTKRAERLCSRTEGQKKSTAMEPSFLFQTLVRRVDAEDFTNEKIHAADLPVEINDVAS